MLIGSKQVSLLMTLLTIVLFPSLTLAGIGPALSGLTGSANDATAAFFSPAGITRLEQPEIVVQTIFTLSDSKFGVDDATYDGGDSKSAQTFAVIPGFFYTRPSKYNDRLHFGAALNVPSGIGHDYGSNWAGRYVERRNILAFVSLSGVVAYELTEQLSVAVGPYLMYVDEKITANINNLEPGRSDGRVKLEENGTDVGFMLGAMYQFTEATRIALTYRSELKPDLDGTPSYKNVGPLLRESLAALDLLGTDIEVDFTVPQQLQVGLYSDLTDRLAMTADLIWIDMSEFGVTHVNIDSHGMDNQSQFQDMYTVTAGLEYKYGKDRAVSVGALYANAATKKSERTFGMPLDRIIGGGVGLSMPISGYLCHFNLNYFDLGKADTGYEGGPLVGDVEGSFDRNFTVMFDIQIRKLL
ncbi:MAG: outer membrane protein transport protein [Deltaproteobacteria bacterium]|nr:outer membrane protein transport protein [Deltaproteobacteria bacterium]